MGAGFSTDAMPTTLAEAYAAGYTEAQVAEFMKTSMR
jgi:hypothetical protein